MNYKMMGRFLAQILAIEGLLMIPALLISVFGGEAMAIRGFLCTIALCGAIAGVLWAICRKAPSAFYAKDGLVCVGVSWVVLSMTGCLPFVISREIPRYIDAFFEIVSGFTTTGSSILTDVEALSDGILFWRSFSHWIGGMGVLVFLLAFTGGKGQGFTMHLLRAESPGPNVGKLVPKMRTTATILYVIYIVMTIINVIFLLLGDMPLFDAVCTALGTAGTGGFGIKAASIGGYNAYLQWIIAIFMLLFGVNFNLYYLILVRSARHALRSTELWWYLGIVTASSTVITVSILPQSSSFGEALRHAVFQVSSIITTTGYATTDFNLWPQLAKGILFVLMFIGGCAGSTAGGLKVSRITLMFRCARRELSKMLHPRSVGVVHLDGKKVDAATLNSLSAYIMLYFTCVLVLFLILCTEPFDFETNLSAAVACFNNVGPGFGAVGPAANFAGYSDFATIVLSFAMLLGRLEIVPILIAVSPSTWTRR